MGIIFFFLYASIHTAERPCSATAVYLPVLQIREKNLVKFAGVWCTVPPEPKVSFVYI